MICNTTNFHEGIRYDYPLTPQSRVIDCGYHEGEFSRRIANERKCTVDAFEPIKEWYDKGVAENLPGVRLHHGAVGVRNGFIPLKKHGAMTGQFADGEIEYAPLVLIDDVIGKGCDLLKLNIEGAEFDVLERMLKLDLVQLCRDIQVQFHTCAPMAEPRWKRIRSKLLETHELTFDFPWCWENYRLKTS